MPEEHVGNDVEVVAQGQVLIDGGDPQGGSLSGAVEGDCLTVPVDLAAVWDVDAGDGLDEDRLPRAVVAREGGDLSSRHIQVDVAVGLYGPEVLGDTAEAQQGLIGVRFLGSRATG